MTQNCEVENFTTIVTDQQFLGRGQAGNKWVSEPFKNLIFSTFICFNNLPVTDKRYLNFAVSLAVFDTLKAYKIFNLKIKWPNDIMSANKKLCGILIENSIQKKKIASSVVGIGINVNQEIFPKNLQTASSIKNSIQKEVHLEELLKNILTSLQKYIALLEHKKFFLLEKQYLKVLYKKGVPTAFKNLKNKLFMGIVKGVSANGSLQVELENGAIKEFEIKEIKFL